MAKSSGTVGGAVIKNFKYSGKGKITTQKLVSDGAKVAADRIARIEKKYGRDFGVTYDKAGRISFPNESTGGKIRSAFGKGDKVKAWAAHKKKLISTHGSKKGLEMFDKNKKKYAMHHTYKDGVFELVDRDVHTAFAHTGGDAWHRASKFSAVGAAILPETVARMRGEREGEGSYIHSLVQDAGSFVNPLEDLQFLSDAAVKHVPGAEHYVEAVNRAGHEARNAASDAIIRKDNRGNRLLDLFSLDGLRGFSGY